MRCQEDSKKSLTVVRSSWLTFWSVLQKTLFLKEKESLQYINYKMIGRLYSFPLNLEGLLIIDKDQENEWKFILSFCHQLVQMTVYKEYGFYIQVQQPQLPFVFSNLNVLNQLLHQVIKVRKDVNYAIYKQSEEIYSHSMFDTFCKVQDFITDQGVFAYPIKPQFDNRFRLTKYSIIDGLVFSHLHKSRSFHRIISKTTQQKLNLLANWYNGIIRDFEISHQIDPLYLPKKEQRTKFQQFDKSQQDFELIQAVEGNALEKFKELLASGRSIYSIGPRDKMMIPHLVCVYDRLDFAQHLQSIHVDWECEDNDKMTPFFYAIKAHSEKLIRFLVQCGVNIEHRDVQERTPFYYACSLGDLPTVRLLHSFGANINAKTSLGRTPFSKSSFLGLVQIVEFLLSIGVDAVFADKQGRNALHNAAFGPKGGRDGKKVGTWCRDSPVIVQLLLEHGMDVESEDKDKNTPLHVAASSEALDSIPLLVAFGGDVNRRNKWGETPLMVAAKFDHVDSAKIFVEQCNADIYAMNEGNFAIDIAGKLGRENVFSYLLDRMKLTHEQALALLERLLVSTKHFSQNAIIRKLIGNHPISAKHLLPLILEMSDCQLELLKTYVEAVKVDSEDIQTCFENSLKRKSMVFLFALIKLANADYELKLRKSVIDHLLLLPEADIEKCLFELNLNWPKYNSKANEGFLERLIQKHKTGIIVQIVNFFKLIKEGKEYHFGNRFLLELTYNDVVRIIKGGECSLPDYAIIHKTMDIYEVISALGINQESHITIPAYQVEIEQVKDKDKENLQPCEVIDYVDMNEDEKIYFSREDVNFQKEVLFIDSVEQLQQAVDEISQYFVLGVDTEQFSDKLEQVAYKFLCTVQISTVRKDYVLDIMKLRPHKKLIEALFKNPKQVKVFHGCETDLRCLLSDLRIVVPNLYDTAKMDLILRNHANEVSLQKLCNQYLGIHLDKRYQKSDWRIRPLPQEMLNYARLDSACLLYLFPKLLKKVVESGQLKKVQESCQKKVNVPFYININ